MFNCTSPASYEPIKAVKKIFFLCVEFNTFSQRLPIKAKRFSLTSTEVGCFLKPCGLYIHSKKIFQTNKSQSKNSFICTFFYWLINQGDNVFVAHIFFAIGFFMKKSLKNRKKSVTNFFKEKSTKIFILQKQVCNFFVFWCKIFNVCKIYIFSQWKK